MPKSDDYYAILGIPREAKDAEIKKAYRRSARKCHPDVNPGDKAAEEKFKKVQEAYDVLIDPKKRALYDQYGFYSENFREQAEGGAGRASQGFDFTGFDFGGSGPGGFRDFFSEIFGTNPSQGERARKGEDLEQHLNISFMESVKGFSPRLVIGRLELCPDCGGSGEQRAGKNLVCSDCDGTGQESRSHGIMRFTSTCRRCGGTGRLGPACQRCNGAGRFPIQETIHVRVPAGADSGFRLRVPRKGNAGLRKEPPGDLYLIITVRPHGFFRREGNDIHCTVPITVTEAALGTKIEVPTIEGRTLLRIPPGTQTGQRFRLRGKGVPSLRGETHGNQIVEVRVVIPRVADERSKEILRELAHLNPDNPREHLARE